MAITRLTDIVAAMKSKWTYGDKDFAYEFEVNQHHNTQYPYMMIIPPDSSIPEVYNGWESYDFEIDFFDLYQTASQQAVSLEQKWDNLEDLALEWLNNVMINFNNPTGAGVGVYFLDESIGIKRIKEVANDRLIQLKMSFTMRGVTKCMFGSIPTNYPSQIPNLSTWLRADSGVTFDTPTKQVSAWADQSGNNNNVAQATKTKQPLRIPYDGASDKTRINFDGTADEFESVTNSPINTDCTIFSVAKANPVTPPFANKYSINFTGSTAALDCGNPLGSYVTVDGNFPLGTTAWSFSNSSASVGFGNLDGTGVTSLLFQDILKNGDNYNVTFNVSNRNLLGNAIVMNNSGVGLQAMTADGQYSFNFTHSDASGNFVFRATSGAIYSVSDVVVTNTANATFSFNDGLGNDKPFSLNIWANNDPTEPWRGWIEKLEVGNKEYQFNPVYSQGYILFRVLDNVTGGYLQQRVTVSQQKGEWDLYTATYDGSGTLGGMKIYINGVESQDNGFAGGGVYNSMHQTTAPLNLGRGNTNGYVGELDEGSVYSKQLSTAEVVEIYNLGNPNDLTSLASSSFNLIGWWRMGDGAVYPTIPDDSSNSNDGTMINLSPSSIRDFSPNSEKSSYFTYELGGVELCLGSSSERIFCHVYDGAGATGEYHARRVWNGDTSKNHIAIMKLESVNPISLASELTLQYNNAESETGIMVGHNPAQTFNAAKFKIGNGTHLGHLDGDIQEIMIYNRALNAYEIESVRNYLNGKYKIY